MKINRLLTLLAVACVPAAASAQTLLSDFSDVAQNVNDSEVTFLDTWSLPDQYVQNSGNISITPNGGDPKGAGSILGRMDLDLTVYTSVEISARADSGNNVDIVSVVFWNPASVGDLTSQGASQWYTFSAGTFAGAGFTQASVDLSAPTGTDGAFDLSAVNYWEIEGDFVPPSSGGDSEEDFRFSFDNLQLTPVPEPSTWAMLALGGGFLAWRRARRK